MARRRRLKVYRTPIGFHDAYVAAPSQKAALEAWGSDTDLFARGSAELVTDDGLVREPLASPGKVIKRLRGSSEEHIAALPIDRPRSKRAPTVQDQGAAPTKQSPETERSPVKASKPPPPRPSRAKLDQAEKKLDDLRERQEKEDRDLCRREDEIKRERQRLEDTHERERLSVERTVERERNGHSKALANWTAKWAPDA